MLALGRQPMPSSILLNGTIYRHQKTVKHDFWAATGFYDNSQGQRIVVKLARTNDFWAIPMRWSGRFLCGREVRFYRALSDLPNIPHLLGTIGQTGFVHEFVAGTPLARNVAIPNGFFAELQQLMENLHRRGIAYVDINKQPNLLIGDNGRPYLIDFQISWNIRDLGDNFLNRWWLKRLQRADRYHLLKHKRRSRPNEMTREELQIVSRPSPIIRLHRFITKPYFRLRRMTIKRLRHSGRMPMETIA